MDNWLKIFCIVCSITLQQKSIKGADDGCRDRERFGTAMTLINSQKKPMNSITIKCTTEVVFEVRYFNKQLCACGKIQADREFFKDCKSRLSLNATILISVENVENARGENCTFTFKFLPVDESVKVTLKMYIKPGQVIRSSLDITSATTSTISRDSTSSLIGQIPIISSSTASRSEETSMYNKIGQPSPPSLLSFSESQSSSFTEKSSRISSTTMYLQPLRSSFPIPYYTAIILTPTVAQPIASSIITSTTKDISESSTSIKSSSSTHVVSSSTPSPTSEEMKKLEEDIEFINNVNTSTIDVNDTKVIKQVFDTATNILNANLTTADQKTDPGMQAVKVLESLGNSISQQLDLGEQSLVTYEQANEDLVFGAAVINVTKSPGFSFPFQETRTAEDELIDIPKSVFVSESGKAYFVGIIFKAYPVMRNNTGDQGFVMGTKVINAIVSPPPNDVLDEPVNMTFKKNKIGETFGEDCSFWIENSSLSGEHGRWSTKQCFRTFENDSHVKCSCYHFTNFAVLFQVTGNQAVSDEDTFRLVIITYIGLSLSILGCLLTFIIYMSLKSVRSDRATIHINLVLALGVADVIFLVNVAAKPVEDENACLLVSMLAFFFYLAVFFWMLVEGVYIYLMVIKVFRGNVARRRRLAYLVGWGCPLLIAIVTWAILRNDVVSKYHCWLSVDSGAIWAFVGPGLTIILVNCIILMAVMRTTWATFVDDKEFGGLKSATKTFGAVIPILGITWVFGVMAFNESSIVFQYIFAITNSIQGLLIFILYCLVNKEVRNELRRRIMIWQTRREMSSSSSNGRRPTYAISSEKNTTFNRTSPQATPDINRYTLQEMEEKPPVVRSYSFENPKKISPKNAELGVEVEDSAHDNDTDRDSGRSSPVAGNPDTNLAYDDSVESA